MFINVKIIRSFHRHTGKDNIRYGAVEVSHVIAAERTGWTTETRRLLGLCDEKQPCALVTTARDNHLLGREMWPRTIAEQEVQSRDVACIGESQTPNQSAKHDCESRALS